MRLLGLLVLVGLLLGGGFLLVLYFHGKQKTQQAIEMVTNPPWLHKTDIYPPAEEKPAAAAPSAHDPYAAKFAELMAKLAGLEASVNDLKQRKPSTTTVVQQAKQEKATVAAPKKQPQGPYFVEHKIDAVTLASQTVEYRLAPGATKLPCVVETAMNSDVPGYFTAKVTSNVYDTATGQHLLVPEGSTILGHDQSQNLIYGNERMDTISLKLTLPDGREVDLGKSPVADQQGVAGLTGDVNNHWWRLFGAVFIGGALKGGMSAMNVAMTEAAGAGQVASGIASVGNQATNRVLQPYINTRPTITVDAGQACNVLLIKELRLPAMWQGGEPTETAQVKPASATRR
jgi:type IV secretion system protein VirB10